jgi:glycosyltransferase involved in cell wall biosynthesis
MDIYAQRYFEILQNEFGDLVDSRQYLPSSPRRFSNRLLNELSLRYFRLWAYPSQAKNRKSAINHIVEPGYAHLMRSLNPDQTVVTVHDMIPILAWRGIIPGMQMNRRPLFAEYCFRFLPKARFLITVSHATKRDLVQHAGCKPERVVVAPNGLDSAFRPFNDEQRAQARLDLGLPQSPKKLVLISGHQIYKNHGTTVKVLRQLLDRRQDVQVVRFARPDTSWETLAQREKLDDKVISFTGLPLEKVVALFNAVDVLLFPSWYEGFGWPPLQAMACGTPVVTSNSGALPEVVGDCGLLRNPSDVDGLTADVMRMLDDYSFRTDSVLRGIERSRMFTWSDHVCRAVDVYQKISLEQHQS